MGMGFCEREAKACQLFWVNKVQNEDGLLISKFYIKFKKYIFINSVTCSMHYGVNQVQVQNIHCGLLNVRLIIIELRVDY